MRILVLQLKRIGDAVLTAPALAALRLAMPAARVELVLAGAAGQMAELFRGSVSAVHTMHGSRWNVGVWRRALSGKWDAVIDFSGTDRSAALGLVTRAPVRLGYEKDARNKLRLRSWTHMCTAAVRDLHTVDFHHALVNSLLELQSIPSQHVIDPGHLALPPDLTLPNLPEKFAIVHPGTARLEKYWPAERWVQVIQHLQTTHNLPVVLTGSNDADETKHLGEILAQTKVWGNLAGQLSLLQLAGVLQKSRIVLGVDSAAMHMAASFRRPQVALFGPTNPYHWRPRQDKARVILAAGPEHRGDSPRHQKAPMVDLAVEWVTAATDEVMQIKNVAD